FQSFDNKFCEYFKMLEELKNHISRYWSLRGKYLHSDKFEKQRKIKICSYKKLDISNNLEMIKNDNVIVCKYIDCYSDAITSITEIPSPLIEAPRSEHHYKLSSKISYTKTLEKYYKQIVSPSGVRNLKIYAIINTLQNDDKNIIASNSFCEQIVEDIISTIVSEKINEFNIVLRITAEYFGSTNNLIICAIINFLNILRAYKLSEKFAKLFENDFWCREYYYNADCGITEKTEESSYYSLSCVSKKNLNFCILTALTDQRIDINGLQKIFENTIDDLINEKKDIYEQIKNSKLIFD
ncbi:MAG TPA: hypothetical protein PLJ38_06305, partial [bacterium]|nr:hypothetical protein [bacterium]